MRNLFFIHILLMVGYTAASQAICGFDEIHQKKMKTDPAFRKAVQETELSVQRYISKNKSKLSARTTGTNAVVYTIPVVVHVMHTGGAPGTIYNPSDAQIQNAINYLNQVYNGTYPGTQGIGDLQLQFVLAAKDPLCNSSPGIDRVNASVISGYSANGVSSNGTNPGVDELSLKNLSRWNPFQYYNIWVVNKIDGKDGTSGTFIAGYAYFPGGNPVDDGMIMLATQMMAGQKTLPHEMGHAFGLYHTFEGSNDKNSCPVDTSCYINGDKVCDTDPETYNQLGGVIDFSCRTGINSCTGTPYSINTESNYMNYTTCYNLFTAGQKTRMLAYTASVFRKSLTTSSATNAVNSFVFSPPTPASCTPISSATALSADFAGIFNMELNNKDIGSSLVMYDNGYVDGTASCLNVVQLTKGSTYNFTATVYGHNQEQLRGWIDYNNDGLFDNATEQIIFANSIPASPFPSVSSSFTVPSTATVNTVLRLRVMDDASTVYGVPPISSACINPAYGQAEDYAVYITANAILPVTLNSFTGELKNRSALLSWNTSGEQDVKSFSIEKSIDASNYSVIATVYPKNNTASSNDYTYSDVNLSENNYYRLRLNETNAAGKLSHVVFLHDNGPKQKLWLLKNPINSSIQFGCTKAGTVAKLQLVNSIGAVLAEKTITTSEGQINWNLQNRLAPGTYIVRAFAWGETFTYKVIKQY